MCRGALDARMNDHMSILFTYIFTISFFFFLTTLPQSHCQPPPDHDYYYSVCREQQLYNCGNLSNIPYPFWGDNQSSHCGGGDPFKLNCQKHDNTTTIRIGSQDFTVMEINPYSYTIRMAQTDLAHNACSPIFGDTHLSSSVFGFTQRLDYVAISYDCSFEDLPFEFEYQNFTCGHENGIYHMVWEGYQEPSGCKRRIQVPSDAPLESYDGGGLNALQRVLGKGFEVNYNFTECVRCMTDGGGVCGTNDEHQFACFYPHHRPAQQFAGPKANSKNEAFMKVAEWNWKRKCIMGAAAAMIGFLIGITIFCFKRKSSISQGNFWLTTKSNQDIEAFLKNQGAQTLKRYKFSDVKKMTNSFKVKLGQGGFGTVYEGKLLTGCLVAVKVLNPSKGNNEDFINEVASISRTSHVNVVTLLGFCLEGRKKALIYEFMPNGSLDKFIYRKDANFHPLSWDILYQISIGIARGLEYLHKGCNTRILHFDIKPHNILLDENFCPKISDFGLAKLCPEKQSIISMSDARGTMGYVAPEVWNRHFGGVSHKSDVYSYGMMLLEMVGGRKNINAEASHTSEIYFPHWVYKRLEEDIDLRQNVVMSSKENEISKKMIMVGLWCIQTIPNDRPTMRRVIDMLEGNTNSLEMPPKPFLSSPTRSVAESSTSLN